MENKDLKKLLDQYLSETIGSSDLDHLLDSLRQEDHKDQWQQSIEELLHNKSLPGLSDGPRMEQLLQAILTAKEGGGDKAKEESGDKAREMAGGQAVVIPVRPPFRRWWKYAAAMILLSGSAGAFWELHHRPQKPVIAQAASQRFKNDLFPASNKATLTLANGSKIILDSAADGVLAQQGNASVLKSDSGRLAYNILIEKPTAVLYNTVSTPPGGQYHLVLGDGTKVWLDAASSLRFPVFLGAGERTVELTGEAYFEVARNEKLPFTVKTNGVRVLVLGTHFNINAYGDENAIRTTLLEGKVKVSQEDKSVVLQPGQQAQSDRNKETGILNDPDIEEVMAWKNGVFQLKSADIKSIMRQVARWYDVEIKYEGGEIDQTFYGTIPRNVSAINLFKALEETGGVHFKIDGKIVTVSP